MGRTVCAEPQCLYKGALYLYISGRLRSLTAKRWKRLQSSKYDICCAHNGTGTGLFASISVFPSQYYSTNAPCSHFIRPSALWGTGWCSWLRPCLTSRKVAGSISDGVRKFFIDLILPAASGPGVDSSTNRGEYQECFLGGKGGRCVGLTTLPPSCADCL